jgi:GxxExxY protein
MVNKLPNEVEAVGRHVVNAAYIVHKHLGPGLLEKVYESCLEYELSQAGLKVERQVSVPIIYKGLQFKDALRLDLLVNDLVIIELKAVDELNPLWEYQLLSHMKLMDKPLGFLINFNVPLIKNGIRRYRNKSTF